MGRFNMQILLILAIIGHGLVANISYAQTEKPISIGKSDFLIEKEEILADAKRLVGQAQVGLDSLDYARSHEAFHLKVAKAAPPVTSWTDAEQETIESVPEPSETAMEKLTEHRAELDRQQDERAFESEASFAARRLNNLEQQKLDAINVREENSAKLRERQLDYRDNRYGYGGFYGYGYPVYPVRPRPRGTPAPTPLFGAGGLVPR